MKIDNDLLCKLENLAALQIAKDKRAGVIEQLSEIVAFVENLNELDLDLQEPTFTILAGGTPLRKDIPSTDLHVRDTILEHAPKRDNGYFVVPKIIE
ncbi:MAG: Asp-tRNA(Asn)/Glu-tRNA(Gln) amidotransferase subunit GatC [Sulfurospirillum sp.]|nr:Asp-tRNA(Asn)/Glu-tRNA(Gln) amidotransferase subunit GatC [Sulfurospirillum sp.]